MSSSLSSLSSSSLDSTCKPHHDWFTAALTFGLCCGLVISYVPQHYRIISTRSSKGLSPWFLLLGTTSSAAGMLNMFTMQWGIIRCCRVLSFGSCLEMTAGVVQVGLQWVMFTLIFVLYIVYYPPHLKYVQRDVDDPMVGIKKGKRTKEWKTSVVLSGVAIVHFFISLLTTLFLLLTFPPSPSPTPSPSPEPIPFPGNPDDPEHVSHSVQQWATFLGVSSALLAAIQYVPQIIHTARHKVVGALSIPMMCIQTPGAVLMVLSIALRPSTNWTSWITFAVAGIMQGTLLVMCICWKVRQSKLGLDDFGNPLHDPEDSTTYGATHNTHTHTAPIPAHPAAEIDVPGLRLSSSASISTASTASTEEEEQKAKRKATQIALANALESAVGSDILGEGGVNEAREIPIEVDEAGREERTPLLRDGRRMRRSGGDEGGSKADSGGGGWFGWRR